VLGEHVSHLHPRNVALMSMEQTDICSKKFLQEVKVRSCRGSCYFIYDLPLPVLDDRIDEFSELIREEYGIEELGDPSSVTEVPIRCPSDTSIVYLTLRISVYKDIVTIVGRLCLDPDADAVASSSKLSPTTLVLEASRMSGSGERVPLKFEPDFGIRGSQDVGSGKSLFPGEILALRGRNGGGGWFSVKEILQVGSTIVRQRCPK
jgi:DNA polymerase alpha subunit B, OB domain